MACTTSSALPSITSAAASPVDSLETSSWRMLVRRTDGSSCSASTVGVDYAHYLVPMVISIVTAVVAFSISRWWLAHRHVPQTTSAITVLANSKAKKTLGAKPIIHSVFLDYDRSDHAPTLGRLQPLCASFDPGSGSEQPPGPEQPHRNTLAGVARHLARARHVPQFLRSPKAVSIPELPKMSLSVIIAMPFDARHTPSDPENAPEDRAYGVGIGNDSHIPEVAVGNTTLACLDFTSSDLYDVVPKEVDDDAMRDWK
ncbi:hypothetical protein FRB94_010492 [Tulasnella sp. JGI-2019a]|nr:hypothetical protein FRB94_010492 [Tulasnella sp. JGI-2019a]